MTVWVLMKQGKVAGVFARRQDGRDSIEVPVGCRSEEALDGGEVWEGGVALLPKVLRGTALGERERVRPERKK